MAFMMPVMKNNFDIYKDARSRKTSECSNASSTSGGAGPTLTAAIGSAPAGGARSARKSESFASSPSHTYRMQMQRCQSSRAFPRNSSRTSHSSAAGALSPTRSFGQASSPPKTALHVRSNSSSGNNNSSNSRQSDSADNQSDMSKFHLRLVEKLRKSFRKDNAKRS